LADTFGQSYSYEKIITKADSIVKNHISKDLLKYFHRDSVLINYDFRKSCWRKYLNRHGQVKRGEQTKGRFERALIFYHFKYAEPMINGALNKGFLPGSIDIIFDANLNSLDRIELSFIPKYVRENRPCDFISMDKAITLGEKANIRKGIEPITATLNWDNGEFKRYCWWITSPLTKEQHDDHIHGEADTVTIDAVTGEILSHTTTTYGTMH
jgi:hypothetical protein